MKRKTLILLLLAACSSLLTASVFGQDFEKIKANNWHHWRGPLATGVSHSAKPPTEWSESDNVRWKVPIDGFGTSTPIISVDKVFVLTAINTGKVGPSLHL